MFAVTNRLLLRPGWPDDAAALSRAVADRPMAHDAALASWTCRPEDAVHWLSRPHAPLRPRFLIARRDSAELVGTLGFTGEGTPEFGCWIRPSCRGERLATEAAEAAMALADHSLRFARLLARTTDGHPAAARLLATFGFVTAGEMAGAPGAERGGSTGGCLLTRQRFGAVPVLLAA